MRSRSLPAEVISAKLFSSCSGTFRQFSPYQWRNPYSWNPYQGGNMNSTYNPGRVAGLWYLLLIAIGPFLLIYIPGKLYVKGNAAATINNIAAHELLFRFGILAELIGGVILVFLVLAFYQLFKRVDPKAGLERARKAGRVP